MSGSCGATRRARKTLRALNDLGVLTSRYDIYQDVMDPANFPSCTGRHAIGRRAWPADIIRRGQRRLAARLGREGQGGRRGTTAACFATGVPLDYAARRIPAELATHPYRCRFIDTTTAAPWQECYSPNHPMTRTGQQAWKMKLLDYVSRDSQLVTGSETGHDAAVPFLDYFEGMMSLGPYRVPDAGPGHGAHLDERPPSAW